MFLFADGNSFANIDWVNLEVKMSLLSIVSIILMLGGGWLFAGKLWTATLGKFFTFLGENLKLITNNVKPEKLTLALSYAVAALLFIGGTASTGYGFCTWLPAPPDSLREKALVKAMESKPDDKEMIQFVVAKTETISRSQEMEDYNKFIEANRPLVPAGVSIWGGFGLMICGIILGARCGLKDQVI